MKRKPVKRRAKKSASLIKDITKIRNKSIYYFNLKRGEKNIDDITELTENIKINRLREAPNDLVKITFIANKSKTERQAITNIYMIDDLSELPEAVGEIWQSIKKPPVKTGKDYMKRINKLKNYISSIVIDFETV